MKSVLLFLIGLLVGANGVYFYMRVHCPAPASAAPPRAVASVEAPLPSPPPEIAATAAPGAAAMPPAVPATPSSNLATPAPAAAPGSLPGALLLPVAGVKPADLTDTFNDTRDAMRRHEALDIMAARGTPVLAASDGTITKLFTSVPGGLTIYEFDPTKTYAYYYAHLDRYAAGLLQGNAVKRGDLIGYVGSTGNASADAPHLHFAIFVLGPEKQWWKGTAIDPYPLLAEAR
jgi:murein DD-endopeptidase MepM/ murein hydrolase activator NlpD